MVILLNHSDLKYDNTFNFYIHQSCIRIATDHLIQSESPGIVYCMGTVFNLYAYNIASSECDNCITIFFFYLFFDQSYWYTCFSDDVYLPESI